MNDNASAYSINITDAKGPKPLMGLRPRTQEKEIMPRSVAVSEDRIRAALPRTWHAFFARFPRLREVQTTAILPILAGKNCLVNAPTASGKTEAIIAPVIEAWLARRERAAYGISPRQTLDAQRQAQRKAQRQSLLGENPQSADAQGPPIIVIAPTKALCNDLLRRIQGPASSVGLVSAIKTSDSSNFRLDKAPHILITTPESLDSLLSRRPKALLALDTLIIDEIHLLAASARGDQLQCLISRLRSLNKERHFQVCASSATVPRMHDLAVTFLGPESEVICVHGKGRKIVSGLFRANNDAQVAQIIEEVLLETPTRKIIIFANARAMVENLVLELRKSPRLASNVYAHHGSMSKEERLRTEVKFLQAKNAACVATSTLELGIDIDDVDRIIVVGPPPDVSSLIQRIGRGNRQSQSVHVICIASSDFDAKRFEHLVECARNENLFPDPVAFRPNVAVQQAFSISLQNPQRWVGKHALYERLSPDAQDMLSEDDCGEILDKLVNTGYMRKVERGRYIPEAKLEFLFDRGYMHSMISDKNETDVIDAVTGRNIGSIRLKMSSKEAILQGNRPALTLAGKRHEVSYMRDAKLFVSATGAKSVMGFSSLEPPRYSLELAQNFARYMHVPIAYIHLTPTEQGFHVDHYLGSIGSQLLGDYFTKMGAKILPKSQTPFHLKLANPPIIEKCADEEQLLRHFELFVSSKLDVISRLLQPGPWLSMLPENIVKRWVLASLDLGAYAKLLANLPIVVGDVA